MRIELCLPQKIALATAPRDYDESLDDIRSILSDVCRALEDDGAGKLIVSGFGQQQWPVDVGTDLAVLLEQLPDLIRSLGAGIPAVLDFYEQGIERALVFTPAEDCYEVLCEGRRDWQPSPSMERIERTDLLAMLSAVRDSFMTLVPNSSPELAEHPWVVSWLEGERP
jgi:hypothetical protein